VPMTAVERILHRPPLGADDPGDCVCLRCGLAYARRLDDELRDMD
jgi:hypothetical protein